MQNLNSPVAAPQPHLILIQVIVVLFAFYAGTRAVGRFRKGTIGTTELILWLFFWMAAGFCVLVPNITWSLARLLGVGRGVDAVIYLTLVGLSYAFFRLYLRLRQTEQQITLLVRKLALKEAPKPDEP
jgi:small membrane protein